MDFHRKRVLPHRGILPYRGILPHRGILPLCRSREIIITDKWIRGIQPRQRNRWASQYTDLHTLRLISCIALTWLHTVHANNKWIIFFLCTCRNAPYSTDRSLPLHYKYWWRSVVINILNNAHINQCMYINREISSSLMSLIRASIFKILTEVRSD